MGDSTCYIRDAHSGEFQEIGALMVTVYSRLDGFPKEDEQPRYYEMLRNIGKLTENPKTRLLVADYNQRIAGAVVYFGDIRHYGSGGTASKEINASGFRLLAVSDSFRGKGIGRLLVEKCIELTKEHHFDQVIIHSTMAMETARKMYKKIGFKRSEDLDFIQGDLPVYGFRLKLS